MDDIEPYRAFLGKQVDVIVDRPIGSRHPRFEFVYEVNYGYVAGTLAGDGSEIDAYVLGQDEPVSRFRGICIAIIVRRNDNEHKLVVSDRLVGTAEIERQTTFVEQYFDSTVQVR